MIPISEWGWPWSSEVIVWHPVTKLPIAVELGNWVGAGYTPRWLPCLACFGNRESSEGHK